MSGIDSLFFCLFWLHFSICSLTLFHIYIYSCHFYILPDIFSFFYLKILFFHIHFTVFMSVSVHFYFRKVLLCSFKPFEHFYQSYFFAVFSSFQRKKAMISASPKSSPTNTCSIRNISACSRRESGIISWPFLFFNPNGLLIHILYCRNQCKHPLLLLRYHRWPVLW